MGGDGGSIPKRAELVKTSKKKEEADKDMARDAKWSYCAITQRELMKPIVACELGKLYNKESVIEFLLDRTISDSASHIRSLKDIKELNLTPNTGYDEKCRELAGHFDSMAAKYICPVAGVEMNGKYRFCCIWTCGCVLSERAMKEVPSEVCHKCGKVFNPEDVIVLNGDEDDSERQKLSMETRRQKLKQAKKSKKLEKVQASENGQRTDNSKRSNPDSLKAPVQSKKMKEDFILSKGKTKVNESRAERKTEKALDPKSTIVYKSLFTSSKGNRDKSKDKTAHWVTYNPYHL